MPELPEVQTVLNGLEARTQNSIFTGLSCIYPGTVISDPACKATIFPARITGYERRGKYLILHLSTDHSIIVHLRMTGKLVFEDRGLPDAAYKHLRAYFTLENGTRILFIDIRTFGKITLCKTENLERFITRLGPEPLSLSFDAKYLHLALKNKKSPIKNALLDQRIVAGLGNIYVCEILYRAGIRPDTRASDILCKQLNKIVLHTKEVLLEALAHNGTSISDFRRVDDKSGEFQNFLRAYQKKLCPHGHEILRVKLAGRSSFYCPKCQK